MKNNRKWMCAVILSLNVIASVLMSFWKHGIGLGYALIMIAGSIAGALLIYNSYGCAKRANRQELRWYRRWNMRNYHETEMREDYSPSMFAVIMTRLSGWTLCTLPLFLFMLPF